MRQHFDVAFPPASFEFIYSLGMFALGCPFTVELCDKFYSWLTPGGEAVLQCDRSGGVVVGDARPAESRRLVYRFLPRKVQERWDERANHVSVCELTISELRKSMRQTSFPRFRVTSRPCTSPLWKGRPGDTACRKVTR